MILPLQENSNDSAKYLILLGSRDQKPGKTGFGVELEGPKTDHRRGRAATVITRKWPLWPACAA